MQYDFLIKFVLYEKRVAFRFHKQLIIANYQFWQHIHFKYVISITILNNFIINDVVFKHVFENSET